MRSNPLDGGCWQKQGSSLRSGQRHPRPSRHLTRLWRSGSAEPQAYEPEMPPVRVREWISSALASPVHESKSRVVHHRILARPGFRNGSRAAALLSASPQLAEAIRAGERFESCHDPRGQAQVSASRVGCNRRDDDPAQLRGYRNASRRSARRDVAVTFEQHILQKITAGGFLA